jgi:hypothetical protein
MLRWFLFAIIESMVPNPTSFFLLFHAIVVPTVWKILPRGIVLCMAFKSSTGLVLQQRLPSLFICTALPPVLIGCRISWQMILVLLILRLWLILWRVRTRQTKSRMF